MAEKAQTGFETFAEVLKNMTPAHRAKLIENHQNFSKLRGYCEAKGYIENLPGLTGVIVLKNTKEVKELRKVVDFLQPGKFKWEYKNKKRQKRWEVEEKELLEKQNQDRKNARKAERMNK